MANRLYNKQVANPRVALKKGGFLKKVGKAAAGVGAAVLAAKGFRKKPAGKKKDAVDKYFAKKGMSLKTGDASAAEAMAKSDRDKKIFRRGLDKIAAAGGVSKLKAGGKVKQSKTGDAQIAESNYPKTDSAIKRITNSKAYKKADYKGKTEMLGGKVYTMADMEKRIGKKFGGSLKSVPADKKGLAKLPTKVRNKMGFMKKGGKVK
jgi:hypothetical protein